MSTATLQQQRVQEFAYKAARFLALPYFTWRFNTTADPEPDLPAPYVVVANHVTELDFFFLGKIFKTPMGFVVGHGLLQNKLLGKLLVDYFGCIGKQKGVTDMKMTMTMLRRLQQGRNLAIFVEGNTTFDGRTGPFPPATGGLLKAMNAGLVTVRIEGGYFALPRWGRGIRKGRTRCKVINTFTKDRLAQMSGEEINGILQQDLYEDAYARQEKEQVAYRGKNPAKGIEHTLYLCPQCESLNTIKGQGRQVVCASCQAKAEYTDKGYLEGDFTHRSILDWTVWQAGQIRQGLRGNGGLSRLHDEEHTLLQQMDEGEPKEVARGLMEMDSHRLSVGEVSVPIDAITGFETFRKNILQLSLKDGRHLQTAPKEGFNALKYRDLYQLIREERM